MCEIENKLKTIISGSLQEYFGTSWLVKGLPKNILGVNTPFKFAVFAREGAAPLPCIKGDRDSDRPWGQVSQNQSENDKKGKIVQRSQLCDHLVGRRDTMNAESNETLPVSEKYMLTIKEAAAYFNIGLTHSLAKQL